MSDDREKRLRNMDLKKKLLQAHAGGKQYGKLIMI